MSKQFNFDFLQNEVSTQYNDYKGLSAIDEHGDGRGLYQLLQENDINPKDYLIYAVTMFDFEAVGTHGLTLKFYLIERATYGNSFDKVSEYNGTINLTEKEVSIKHADLQKYIKRISIGVVSPISSHIQVELP